MVCRESRKNIASHGSFLEDTRPACLAGRRYGGRWWITAAALGSLLAMLISRLLALAVVSTLSLLPNPAQADETLSYDANGNVIARTLSSATTTYDYDVLWTEYLACVL